MPRARIRPSIRTRDRGYPRRHVKKVLFCTDLGADVAGSAEVAMQQARNLGAQLLVVHVEPSATQGLVPLLDEARPGGRRAQRIEALRAAVPIAASIPHTHRLLQGDPARAILDFAAREGVDLIVLPTPARSALDRLLRGSVSVDVVRHAPCPVYTFHPKPPATTRPKAPLPALGLVGSAHSQHGRDVLERELTILLSGEVAALRMWFRQQLDAVRIIAEEPLVVASVLELCASRRHEVRTEAARERLRGFMHVVGRGCSFADFVALDAKGEIVASRVDAHVGQVLPPSRHAFVRSALAGRSVVSPPTVVPLAPPRPRDVSAAVRPTLFAAAPISDDRGPCAAIALWLRGDDFNRLVATSSPYRSIESYVFDRQGTMLSPSRFESDLARHALPLERDADGLLHLIDPGGNLLDGHVPHGDLPLTRMARAAVAGDSGIDLDGYRDYRGVQVVGAWHWLADEAIGVAIEVDRDEAFPS